MQAVRKLLENHSQIRRLPPMTPVTFRWIGGGDTPITTEESTDGNRGGSDGSDASDEVRDTRPNVSEQPEKQKEPANEPGQNSGDTVLTPSLASLSSPSAENENNIVLDDNIRYKVLKAMELATLDYKQAKAEGYESGALFTAQDVWYHLGYMFRGREWNMDKVRKVLRQQVRKGNALIRHGDAPDRYYLTWRRDDNGE